MDAENVVRQDREVASLRLLLIVVHGVFNPSIPLIYNQALVALTVFLVVPPLAVLELLVAGLRLFSFPVCVRRGGAAARAWLGALDKAGPCRVGRMRLLAVDVVVGALTPEAAAAPVLAAGAAPLVAAALLRALEETVLLAGVPSETLGVDLREPVAILVARRGAPAGADVACGVLDGARPLVEGVARVADGTLRARAGMPVVLGSVATSVCFFGTCATGATAGFSAPAIGSTGFSGDLKSSGSKCEDQSTTSCPG